MDSADDSIAGTCTFKVIENEWITLSDGRRLAMRMWLPDNSDTRPVPAILEYLPYRKRDGTAPRDESTYPVFASHGYAGVRVDIAGHGESDGRFDDEYSTQELSDGIEVIHWIAEQPWCTGKIGLMGISWGGFNSLQLAAMQPEPVKAVISLSSVVDRYNQDIHYRNGCQLYSNLYWATVMLSFASRPPDPQLREDWREIWLDRLNNEPWLYDHWMQHQRRDDYWQHGSVCEDYNAITAATLIIGGWADLYVDAPVDAIENFSAPCKAINGPWIHKYPHFAWPRPRMDFHAEALAWWDRWLKGSANHVEALPAYRAFIAEATRPAPLREHESGRWVAEENWPSPNTNWQTLHLTAEQTLESTKGSSPADEQTLCICSPQDCGTAGGEIFSLKADSELPGDQRIDDAGSLVFESAPLTDAIEILGAPILTLSVSIDQPYGNLIARLIDVHPDGLSHRVSWVALNLAHRNNNERPVNMTPGKSERITLTLDQCGYRFMPGHRIRLSISTAYWPMLIPPPYAVTASVDCADATLALPTRPGGDQIPMPEPANPSPLPTYQEHKPAENKRWVERDLQQGVTRYHLIDDTGEHEMPEHGLRTRHRRIECWTIAPDNPLSATGFCQQISWTTRGDWSVRTEASSDLSVDSAHFHCKAVVKAFENDALINEREWCDTIERNFM